YFVPQMNPDVAPQRLGAVGSQVLNLRAGETEKLTLPVYCIDSHRGAPSDATPFRVAGDRIPVELSSTIKSEATKASAGYGGLDSAAPAAKSAVQGQVWKYRDQKWIKLQGEGPQEATK